MNTVILTHTNADFDAVAALLGAHKLYPNATPLLPDRLNHNVSEFITLYQNGLPFVHPEDIRLRTIQHVILVDTARLPALKALKRAATVQIIDHHTPPPPAPNQTVICESVGAITTFFVEQIDASGISLNSLEATLLMLGIYSDTGALTYGTTTPRDVRAAAWLLERGAVLDTVRRFLTLALSPEQQQLFDLLINASESRIIQGYTIMVCAVRVDSYVTQISTVVHRLRDMLDTTALFVVVEMPKSTLLVCRAAVDVINVGAVAAAFGGGGHGRAAAATIYDKPLDVLRPLLWEEIARRVEPLARVADLMSRGVKTFGAHQRLRDVVQEMRRIGHEGYPVIDEEHVVGLLTRRDADRAIEHDLAQLNVRDVMMGGEVKLTPDDSVSALEQLMVKSGWGQIPVVDAENRLIGIVTRTDLIKHWARMHPTVPAIKRVVSAEQLATTLGKRTKRLIDAVVALAQEQEIVLYLVGGTVRDVLLERRNLDIDFVVEGNAIAFADRVRMHLGGEISSFRPFGTAKWMLGEDIYGRLGILAEDGLPDSELPQHLDFATARNEFYEHPTALPTVYSGSIKLDLYRRDFTINTLAVQLSPHYEVGHLLDFYGGESDLQAKLIRVLHSLSFVDDPTRILRAVRFEQRLSFTIETRTEILIETALPMLRRITGERLRHELTLLLQERDPEKGLRSLEKRQILIAIHPAFTLSALLEADFRAVRQPGTVLLTPAAEIAELLWHCIAARIPLEKAAEWTERLAFGRTFGVSLVETARLLQDAPLLSTPGAAPSAIVELLETASELALFTAWALAEDSLRRHYLEQYVQRWRQMQPVTDGHALIAMGLMPGPDFGKMLRQLRVAWLDGIIHNEAEEQALLQQLIQNM